MNLTQSVIITCGMIFSIIVANILVWKSEMTTGDFIAINAYIIQLYMPLSFLGTMWRWIRQAMVDVEMIFEMLDVNEFLKEKAYPDVLAPGDGAIEFKNVSFTYDEDENKNLEDKQLQLDNISFKIEPK